MPPMEVVPLMTSAGARWDMNRSETATHASSRTITGRRRTFGGVDANGGGLRMGRRGCIGRILCSRWLQWPPSTVPCF